MNTTWMRPRAEDEMTGHDLFQPDTHRLDETARRLHLVPEDRQVINVSGVSVDLPAVEEVMRRHPKVARAAVIGVPDAGTGEAVKAIIVLTEGGSVEQILGWMRDPATGMASYLVPKHIEFRRSLPPTMDGEPEERPQCFGRPTHLYP
jgi:long-chain acyl-CoA synthetase